MNEIKLRIWNKISKEFTYISGLSLELGSSKETAFVKFLNLQCSSIMLTGYKDAEQCTILKDKNNQELYFYDFVTLDKDDPTIYQVVQDDFGIPGFMPFAPEKSTCIEFSTYFLKMEKARNDFEIVGNPYENPELLEAKDDKT